MLKYNETNWRYKEGLQTHSYQVTFDKINSQSTIEEQKERAERLSLVKLFDDNESNYFFEIASRFQKNDDHFYFDKNKKFHTTLLGFPVIDSAYYEAVRQEIKEFSEGMEPKMNIKLDLIRLGTKYEKNNTLKPVNGVSNGTVIAFGDSPSNIRFTTFGNKLTSFLLKDEDLNKVLGIKFRRRFPTVWCTMGHYTTDFEITRELEMIFDEYKELDSDFFQMPCPELELGSSHYKDLRDWKPMQKYSI
ncbi:MAG: hypothetical protein EHM34_09945 [Nitrosopumilales archaeon]|nr:MAG: hypothetical protein EHM34_09945 [Nitrosopumilales archaeon]